MVVGPPRAMWARHFALRSKGCAARLPCVQQLGAAGCTHAMPCARGNVASYACAQMRAPVLRYDAQQPAKKKRGGGNGMTLGGWHAQ